jgi:hypothetical protein
VGQARVSTTADLSALRARLGVELSDEGTEPDRVIRELVVGQFGFVGRAILPAAGFQPALAAPQN